MDSTTVSDVLAKNVIHTCVIRANQTLYQPLPRAVGNHLRYPFGLLEFVTENHRNVKNV